MLFALLPYNMHRQQPLTSTNTLQQQQNTTTIRQDVTSIEIRNVSGLQIGAYLNLNRTAVDPNTQLRITFYNGALTIEGVRRTTSQTLDDPVPDAIRYISTLPDGNHWKVQVVTLVSASKIVLHGDLYGGSRTVSGTARQLVSFPPTPVESASLSGPTANFAMLKLLGSREITLVDHTFDDLDVTLANASTLSSINSSAKKLRVEFQGQQNSLRSLAVTHRVEIKSASGDAPVLLSDAEKNVLELTLSPYQQIFVQMHPSALTRVRCDNQLIAHWSQTAETLRLGSVPLQQQQQSQFPFGPYQMQFGGGVGFTIPPPPQFVPGSFPPSSYSSVLSPVILSSATPPTMVVVRRRVEPSSSSSSTTRTARVSSFPQFGTVPFPSGPSHNLRCGFRRDPNETDAQRQVWRDGLKHAVCQKQEDRNGACCTICTVNVPNVRLEPCGDVVMCAECALRAETLLPNSACPVCRADVCRAVSVAVPPK